MTEKITISSILWDIYAVIAIVSSLSALGFMAVSLWYIREALENGSP